MVLASSRLLDSFLACSWLLTFLLLIQATGAHSFAPSSTHPVWKRNLQFGFENSTLGSVPGAGISRVQISSGGESYFTVIQVGPYNFRVALDTGSSDLWMVDSDCTASQCQNLPTYPLVYPNSTFQSVNSNQTNFNVQFADTTAASGFVGKEEVTFANLSIPDQALGLVSTTNVTLTDEITGILGLGFSRLSAISSSVNNSAPFFARLAQEGLLDYPLFGLSLTRNDTGTLAIGAIDGTVVTNVSRVVWNKVVEFSPFGSESNSSSYLQWVIPMSSFSFDNTSLTPEPTYPGVAKGNQSLALIDVGFPGIAGPIQDVSRLFQSIDDSRLVDSESGMWAIPCETDKTISFAFGGHEFVLQPTDYLIGPAAGNPDLCLTWPVASASDGDGIDWQIGTAFLRSVYSVFSFGIDDKEPPIIGFFPLTQSNNLTESSDEVSTFLSSISATIATTLPDSLLSTPTESVPSYIFNSSIAAPTGGIVTSALGASTYSPIFAKATNLSAIPFITPTPTATTIFVTDASGVVSSTVIIQPSIVLGAPHSGAMLAGGSFTTMSCSVLFAILLPILRTFL